MKVTVCQQVEGVEPGEDVDVSDERGRWLLDNGYAIKASTDTPSEQTTPDSENPGGTPRS